MARPSKPSTDFIEDLLSAIARRSKALKHMAHKVSVERVADREQRKLEITFMQWPGHQPIVRIFAWDDRWIWVDARRGTKSEGWLWAYTNEGRLVGGLAGRELVEAAEATIAVCHEMTGARIGRFDEIWAPILAAGPRAIP